MEYSCYGKVGCLCDDSEDKKGQNWFSKMAMLEGD